MQNKQSSEGGKIDFAILEQIERLKTENSLLLQRPTDVDMKHLKEEFLKIEENHAQALLRVKKQAKAELEELKGEHEIELSEQQVVNNKAINNQKNEINKLKLDIEEKERECQRLEDEVS